MRLTPYAWAKLLFLRDLGRTEVGGFGLTPAGDLLLVEDFCLVPQCCTEVTVGFADEGVADFFEEQVEAGRRPEQFARIWVHTHPGNSAQPSGTDEETFERCFGSADWALMFILAQGGQTYARLRFAAGPQGQFEIPVEVDFQHPFPASDFASWEAEYTRCVARADFMAAREEVISYDQEYRRLEALLTERDLLPIRLDPDWYGELREEFL